MRGERLRVFTGTAHPRLAQDICGHMGIPLGAASLTRFPDGELNLIPFAALKYMEKDKAHFLTERYTSTYLTSGRDLLRKRPGRGDAHPDPYSRLAAACLGRDARQPVVCLVSEWSR